jgi:hypothetical protein
VVVFLSTEWLAALDDAARHAPPVAALPAGGFVLEQQVRDVGDENGDANGEVRYRFVFEGDGLRVEPVAPGDGDGTDADLTFVCDRATAVALARGDTTAQQALTAGALRLRRDVDRFAAARDALLAIGDVFATVRAATEF